MAQEHGLQLLPEVPGASGGETLKAILNPCGEPYWKLAFKGGCQELFFLNTLDKSPEFAKIMYAIAANQGYPASEIGIYIQPVQQGVSCHIEFNTPFDPANHAEVNRARQIYVQGSEEMLKHGAYYSRPYGIWSRMAFSHDAQTTMVLRKIKGIFDPNNIMNPGKLCF
jgi:FAD/FMN-containing dehydrogenase